MWFVLLAIALTVVGTGGLYFRRRVVQSLDLLGVSLRAQRIVLWVIPLLLFAYPLALFVYIGASVAFGRDSIAMEPTGLLLWLVVYPFWLSVLTLIQSLPFLIFFDVITLFSKLVRRSKAAPRYRAGAILLVVGFFSIYTPARITLARDVLTLRHYELGEAHGVEASKPFRIVFWGDLQRDQHTGTARSQQVVDLINTQEADLVLFGGDWINTGSEYIQQAAVVGGDLQSRLGTFSVRGDHEHFAYLDEDRSVEEMTRALKAQAVEMPHNEVRWFEHQGKRIGVAFLSHNYIVRRNEEGTLSLLDQLASADYSILLTHQLDTDLANVAKDRVDLVLGAHTHGGQVNPVVGFMHIPLARVETPFVEGRYQLSERTTVIVTAGIGYSIAPFRYASPASIEVLNIRI